MRAERRMPARMSRTVCIPRYSLHVVTRRKAKVPRARQRLQYCLSLVSRLSERGSAAAIMEWVEGRPNSLSHRSSSRTAGGIAGRGHLRTSFRTCSDQSEEAGTTDNSPGRYRKQNKPLEILSAQ